MVRCETCNMRQRRKKGGGFCYTCGMSISGRKLNRSLRQGKKILYFCCEKCKQIYLKKK